MYLSRDEVAGMTVASLKAFVALNLDEGLYLDYKQKLSGASDKEAKREFLKDITGFANAAGGVLLIGSKEPADELVVEQQLCGVEDGAALAQDLERLASTSIDPRIPGLTFRNVPIGNERSCVVVHVPMSLTRPHMVVHQGHRSFYIRHSESTDPMSTHEIREAVLTAASAEDRARLIISSKLTEAREALDGRPGFFLQAVPLVDTHEKWNVFDQKVDAILRDPDQTRTEFRDYLDLRAATPPIPTIDGIVAMPSRERDAGWHLAVNRDGYVSLLYRDVHESDDHQNQSRPVLHSSYAELFTALGMILDELIRVTRSDVPYVIACAYLNAKDTCLWLESTLGSRKLTPPYGKREIIWPPRLRPGGEDIKPILQDMFVQLYHAFGLKAVIR